jgi:hypothetical protein
MQTFCCTNIFSNKKKNLHEKFHGIDGFILHDESDELTLTRIHNSHQFELQMDKTQFWTFNKECICVNRIADLSTLKYPLSHYIGNSLYNFTDEDNFEFWRSIIVDAINGTPTKHTILVGDKLSYIETKVIYHCKETNEIYGCLVLSIPYVSKYSIKREKSDKNISS